MLILDKNNEIIYLRLNAMFPNLATLNALNFAAAWASANSNIVYFISSAPGLLEPFLNRIQITPGMKYIDLSGCTTNSDVHSLLEPGAQGSLVLIETSKDYFIYLRDLLQILELIRLSLFNHPVWDASCCLNGKCQNKANPCLCQISKAP